MTIANSTTCRTIDIDKVIDLYSDRRSGFVQEDDYILFLRMFKINSIYTQTAQDPNDPTISETTKTITFSESEREYDYWYSKYGTRFDQQPFDENKVYSYNRIVYFNTKDSYEETVKHMLNQSALSSNEAYEAIVQEAVEHCYNCADLESNEIPF